jgi:hypothetical protein
VALGGFSRGRRWLGAAEGLGTAAVVLVVVAVVTYAATRPTLRRRLDLTEGAQFTLSDQTRQILASLPRNVHVDMLMRPEMRSGGNGMLDNGLYEVQSRAIEYVDGLLREYEIAGSGKLDVRRLNPDTDRLEAEALAHALALTRYNVLVVSAGERRHVVRLEDMVTIDRGMAGDTIQPAQLLDLRGEAPLTAALLDVGQDKPPRVGFLRGFGGPSTDEEGNFGLFLFREQVRGQGLQPENVDLLEGSPIPDGLDALVLWGPELPLGNRVRDQLLAFHDKGGALLIGVEPLHEDPDLDELLRRLGLDRERRVLCRDDLPLGGQGVRRSQLAITSFAPEQEITAPIARQGTFAYVANAGGLGRDKDAPPGTSSEPLLTSPPQCFGDAPSEPGKPGDWTLGEGELRGPRALGYAVTSKGGRVVVFGASSFLQTAFLQSSEGGSANLDLGLNSMNWLVRRESSIGSRPRQVYESRVDLTPDENERVLVYVVVLMPLGAVALGLLVWLARRR